MSAIVTGGLGFIGSHLVDRISANEKVQVIDDYRWASFGFASDESLPGFTEAWPRRVSIEVETIRRARPLGSPLDTIYHLASPVGPVGVLGYAGRLVTEVVNDARRVADWAIEREARLVYVSTSEIYGVHDSNTSEDDACVFQPEPSARKEYAIAKLAAETMLLNTPDLDVRIIRPFNVAGPRQRTAGGFVLPRFIEQAKAGQPLTVYGDGRARRAFTHVLDIVDGIVRAATNGKPGGVYNLGNPDNACTIAQLAADVIAITGSESAIEYVDPTTLWGPAFREAPDKVPDITKARTELGWQPTRDRLTVIRDAAGE